MKIGLIGLGKMGGNLALNLRDHNIDVIGYDLSLESRKWVSENNVETVDSMDDLLNHLDSPKVLWLLLPSGEPTDKTIKELSEKLDEGDIIIDAGNSRYIDSINHANLLKEKIKFMDCGTSGGISGARNGACIMVGGDIEAYHFLEDVFKSIAIDGGLMYTGTAGSGHFMKMVHNGIEYGMMQAIGEGFQLMKKSGFNYDLAAVAGNWCHGSVIRGWLMEIVQEQLSKDGNLEKIVGEVNTNGEAKWAVEAGLEKEVPMPVTALSLMVRNASKDNEKFSCKVVAAMRNGFGGHLVKTKE